MFKKLFVSLIVSLFILSSAFANDVAEGKYYKEDLRKHSVKIFNVGKMGLGYASGTLIYESVEKSLILTAKHVIPLNEEFYVEQKQVTKIYLSVKDDLAILVVNGDFENKEPATFGSKNEPVGNEIYYLGYPPAYELEGYYGQGPIVRNTKDWSFAKVKTIGGCSGSGVFNKDLELIGVLWGGTNYDMLFEPLEDVLEFLTEGK